MSKIVFIGHSVVKGTGYGGVTAADTFAHKLGIANGYAAADILNKGVSSDTSAGVLSRLQTDVIAHAPAVCVIMIGVNDWATGVSLATYKSNLLAIVDAIKNAGIKCVLFTDNANRGTPSDFSSYYPYIEAIKEVAAAKKCHVVDIYGRMCQRMLVGDHAGLYTDTIHLSIAGHQFVAEHAARSFYAGFFIADPVAEPEPEPSPQELQPLVIAISDLLISSLNPSMTAAVKAERDKL